ncbi:hypothetical protein CIPAW_01G008900 [Carya illinoinensis]|uniref:Uncharacterized protein n=1 Tax=Carya illinoinensis TaxID=32201 RepID=A0A8T1RH08_CARIL|nr:hypothetical protein CIPAW_01G008900 [Carya illinoinensis]
MENFNDKATLSQTLFFFFSFFLVADCSNSKFRGGNAIDLTSYPCEYTPIKISLNLTH